MTSIAVEPQLSPVSHLAEASSACPARTRALWLDVLLAVMVACAATWLAAWGATRVSPFAYSPAADDVYFNADVVRVVNNMTDRYSDHFRIRVHPLFLIIAYPPTKAVQLLLHLSPQRSAQLVVAGAAGLWACLLFAILRLIGCRRFDALLMLAVACSSAAALFWFTIPETYALGSLSILLAVGVVALVKYRPLPGWAYVVLGTATMGVTITNWMAGLVAAWVRFGARRTAMVALHTFYLTVTVWGVEQAVFRNTPFFFDFFVERHVVDRQEWGGPLHRAGSIFFHSMVMPAYTEMGMPANPATGAPPRPDHRIMTAQLSRIGSGGAWGLVGIVAWGVLLGAGLWVLCRGKVDVKFRLMLGILIAGQVGLHLVYGEEAFLYSLHYLPLLVLAAALATRTRARALVLTAAGVLLICNVVNNVRQFQAAQQFMNRSALRSTESTHSDARPVHFDNGETLAVMP